jgi:DUF2905 family protein
MQRCRSMDARSTGLLIIGLGAAAVLIGLLVMSGGLSWFGRLPGDIRIERESVRIYVPIVSMLLISVAISLLSWAVRRFLS